MMEIFVAFPVGPCALDFSRAKTQDHFWTDPPADELVQRHRISSGHGTPPTCRRPALNVSIGKLTHNKPRVFGVKFSLREIGRIFFPLK